MMYLGSRFAAAGFLLLSSCDSAQMPLRQNFVRDNGVEVKSIEDCDAFIAEVCLIRPSGDYKISLTELGGGAHGKAFRVDFHAEGLNRHFSAIVNKVVATESPVYPTCKDLGQPWCKNILISRDLFYRVFYGENGADNVSYRGVHIDVVESSSGVDAGLVLDYSFHICQRNTDPVEIVCGS